MKDIKELIYAAVEENAVKFQELVNNQLQVRAYDAIESLRPEIGASMFGEAKKMEDDEDEEDMEDEDEDEDEDEKKSKVEEELKGNQHKIDKNKNGKIDGHDFKLLRKEEAEALDEKIEILRKDPNPQGDTVGTPVRYPKGHSAHGDAHRAATAKAAKVARTQGRLKGNDYLSRRRRDYEPGREHEPYGYGRVSKPKPKMEEVVNEVAMPKNQADWQALITHQIKTTGHPVATDAQFRAAHGKDKTKIASLEPGEDKLQYATAQGGTVKQ